MRQRLVDVHSHVVPSGDDGVQSVAEGLALIRDAHAHGTEILYATPHVAPHVPLTEEREAQIRSAYADLRDLAPLELRLGFELTPMPSLLEEDPSRYALAETDHVLVEIPFLGSANLFLEVGEWIASSGRTPIVAHPERTEAVLTNPGLAEELVERGWLLQVNVTSLLGRHGAEMERMGWHLVDDRLAALVASDGHRATRPALLDGGYELTRARVGEERARRLFDGSALGREAPPALRLPSRQRRPLATPPGGCPGFARTTD